MPSLFKYSRELLPSSGPIEDDYINRFLMVSMNVSAWKTGEIKGQEEIWQRFEFNGDSDIMSRISNELLKQ